MKDYRGFLIRNERKRLNISLEALSHGICSPSYLSKIENNTLIANDSIYDLLLEKLEMQLLDKVEEEKLRSMLDLFFKYYMSSNQQLLKIMKALLEYKDKVSSSTLFIQYQLFLLYASEMNLQVTVSVKEVEKYYPYMDNQQREYFHLFRLSSGNIVLSENDDWIYVRTLKAKANLYMYQKHIFKAYDLYKTCLSCAVELGNKNLISEILCSLGWVCLNVDIEQAEKYYLSAVSYDSGYQQLAFYNLGATMLQNKKYRKKGKRYLQKGVKHCKDEFMKIKYKEALFIYTVLYEDKKDAKSIIKDLSDCEHIDVLSMMLKEHYQLNVDYQNGLMKLKDTSVLFKFLYCKNCEFLRKYKDICSLNEWI